MDLAAAVEAVLTDEISIVSPAVSAVPESAAEVSDVDSLDYTLASEYRPASGVLIDAEQTRQLVKPYLPYDGKRRFQADYLPYD